MLGLADGVTVYIEAAEAATTLPLFWASFGLVCLWYVLFSLPVVVDDLLRWKHEHGRVEDSAGWQLAVGHLRVTLHLSIVLQLLKPLGCNYIDHYHAPSAPSAPSAPPPEAEAEAGSGSGYLVQDEGWYAANGTTLPSGQTVGVMQGAAGVHCWDEAGPQPTMALAALLALAFYLLTVHVVGDERVLCRARHGAALDVRYSELYTLVANTLSIVAAAALGLLKATPFVLLGVLVGTFAALLLWTLLYRRCIGHSPCCLRSVTGLRASGYALALWAAICCLVELAGALPPSAPLAPTDGALRPTEVLLLAGWGTVAAVAVGWCCAIECGARRKRWVEAGNLRRCARAMRDAEERWRRAGLLVAPWARGRRRWAWRARTAARVGELARCLAQLEQHVSPDVFGLDSGFVQARGACTRGQCTRGSRSFGRPTPRDRVGKAPCGNGDSGRRRPHDSVWRARGVPATFAGRARVLCARVEASASPPGTHFTADQGPGHATGRATHLARENAVVVPRVVRGGQTDTIRRKGESTRTGLLFKTSFLLPVGRHLTQRQGTRHADLP